MVNNKNVELLSGMFSAIGEKSIPDILAQMTNQDVVKAFYVMKGSVESMQELVLMDILKHAQNSQIGRKEAFADIRTIHDFQKKLPITEYSDYTMYIEQMKKGDKDIQYNGETVSFVATSGTTGISKLIPESKNGETVKSLVSKLRLILLLSMAPEIMMPDKKILSITNPSEYAKTEGDIPIGSASGQAVKDVPKEMQQKLLLPIELILAKNISNDAMDYLILLLALAEENMAGVVCSNIAHFNILLNKIDECANDLLNDISKGEISSKIELDPALRDALTAKLAPNPDRAEKLRDVFAGCKPFDVLLIWPNFSVVSCWMASSAEMIVADVRKRLPEATKFLEWGYGASEGKFNIPSLANDPSGDLAMFGYFFEFLPLGETDATLLAHELKQGEFYEIIITSYSGLYRYNMKDVVYVKSNDNGSPRIVFASKTTECLQLDDMKLYVFEVDQYLKKACGLVHEDVRFYQLLADKNNKKLVFIVEAAADTFDGQAFIQVLEKILISDNSLYRSCRESQQIKAAEIILVKQGYRDALFVRSIMPGKNVNQTKIKTIVNVYPEDDSIVDHCKGEV